MTADANLERRPGWVPSAASHLEVALATAPFAPVFPCSPANKRPALPTCERCKKGGDFAGSPGYLACVASGRLGHGLYDATRDLDRIRSWWQPHPPWLVGAPTWRLVVLDLDNRPRHPDPWPWWLATCASNGWNPAANLLVDTPSGGRHVYFDHPPGGAGNRTALLGASDDQPLVDVRADGGYVIAPGSRLPDGREYSIANLVPELPLAPPWLLELVAKPKPREHDSGAPMVAPGGQRTAASLGEQRRRRYGEGALDRELGQLACASEGTRNSTLNDAAFRMGQLIAQGHPDAHDTAARLHAVALRIGLSDSEARATIRSGLAAGLANPRSTAA